MRGKVGGRKKWIIAVVVLLVAALAVGLIYWRSRTPQESDMEKLEAFISSIGANFASRDYEALRGQFASDSVFVHNGNEYPFEEGLDKLREYIDLVSEMEVGLTVINGSNDTWMRCTANGKLVYDDYKAMIEYKFELERTSGSYWKVTKMEAPRSRWFAAAFSENVGE